MIFIWLPKIYGADNPEPFGFQDKNNEKLEKIIKVVTELISMGRHYDAAVELLKIGFYIENPEIRYNFFWLASYEYMKAGFFDVSRNCLMYCHEYSTDDKQELTSLLFAENAFMEKNFNEALFYYESLLNSVVFNHKLKDFVLRKYLATCILNDNSSKARNKLIELLEQDVIGAKEMMDILKEYERRPSRNPYIGGVLGIIPGLGYAYSGEYANALRSLILNSLFIWAMIETGKEERWGIFSVLAFIEFTWFTGSIYGGIDAAERYNLNQKKRFEERLIKDLDIVPDYTILPLLKISVKF